MALDDRFPSIGTIFGRLRAQPIPRQSGSRRCRSTSITAQLPVAQWHEMIGLDRIVHNAHGISLEGDSLRKRKSPTHLTNAENSKRIPHDANRATENYRSRTVRDLAKLFPALAKPPSRSCEIRRRRRSWENLRVPNPLQR